MTPEELDRIREWLRETSFQYLSDERGMACSFVGQLLDHVDNQTKLLGELGSWIAGQDSRIEELEEAFAAVNQELLKELHGGV